MHKKSIFNNYKVGNISTNKYKKHNILKFENIIELDLNLYKIVKQRFKRNVKIKYKKSIHKHRTRQTNKMHKIKLNNKWGIQSFINRGMDAYNRISTPIKKIESLDVFKNKIKSNLFEKQFKESPKIKKKK